MKTVASKLGLLAALGGAALIFGGAVGDEDRTASTREVEELRSTIKSLENKVARLEDRVQNLENRSKLRQIPLAPPGGIWRTNFSTPPNGLAPRPVPLPPNWGGGEFNGHRYHIFPLTER